MNYKIIKQSYENGAEEFGRQAVGVLLEEIERYQRANQVVELDSWKGTGNLEIGHDNMNYIVTEHRKEKETGEIKIITTEVPKINVDFLWELVKQLGPEVTYRQLVPHLIKHYNLTYSIDAFNGGHNRKTYFKTYQFPARILEHMSKIKYDGRGKLTIR